MKELTRAEEQLMHILWKQKKAFVKDLIEQLPNPKPAYNTISTIIRILEKKGFVSHKAYGKSHEYFPLVEKKEYTKKYFNNFLKKYFGNSFEQMLSFFSNEDEISTTELQKIIDFIEKEKKEASD